MWLPESPDPYYWPKPFQRQIYSQGSGYQYFHSPSSSWSYSYGTHQPLISQNHVMQTFPSYGYYVPPRLQTIYHINDLYQPGRPQEASNPQTIPQPQPQPQEIKPTEASAVVVEGDPPSSEGTDGQPAAETPAESPVDVPPETLSDAAASNRSEGSSDVQADEPAPAESTGEIVNENPSPSENSSGETPAESEIPSDGGSSNDVNPVQTDPPAESGSGEASGEEEVSDE